MAADYLRFPNKAPEYSAGLGPVLQSKCNYKVIVDGKDLLVPREDATLRCGPSDVIFIGKNHRLINE